MSGLKSAEITEALNMVTNILYHISLIADADCLQFGMQEANKHMIVFFFKFGENRPSSFEVIIKLYIRNCPVHLYTLNIKQYGSTV